MSTQNENAGSKSLMKKTKAELIDIILRKDDVEAKLRKELNDVNLDFSKAKEMIGKKDDKITLLTDDINVGHEKEASLYNDINRLKTIRNAFAISAAILLIVIIAIAIF